MSEDLRPDLPSVVATLPDRVVFPEIIRHTNHAAGLDPRRTPRPDLTWGWSDIHAEMCRQGFKPVSFCISGDPFDPVDSLRFTLTPGFARKGT